jgi:hypothetical protein
MKMMKKCKVWIFGRRLTLHPSTTNRRLRLLHLLLRLLLPVPSGVPTLAECFDFVPPPTTTIPTTTITAPPVYWWRIMDGPWTECRRPHHHRSLTDHPHQPGQKEKDRPGIVTGLHHPPCSSTGCCSRSHLRRRRSPLHHRPGRRARIVVGVVVIPPAAAAVASAAAEKSWPRRHQQQAPRSRHHGKVDCWA